MSSSSRPLRILLVTPPLTGHLHPALALADELRGRGHTVAWAGPEPVLRPVLGPGAEIRPTGSRLFREQAVGGTAAIRTLWRDFVVPYARFTLPALRRAVGEWRPDVVLVDQHSPGGALAAHLHQVPWAGFAPSSMELGRPPGEQPELARWQEELLRGLWRRAGLPEDDYVDPRYAPGLILACTSPALLGAAVPGMPAPGADMEPLPPQCVAVGPLLTVRRENDAGFPWERLRSGRRRVLVTLGTLSASVAEDFLMRTSAALTALADRVQAIVAAPPPVLDRMPEHVLGLPRVPVLELLRRGEVDAVLCHGGMNTVCEALAHGVPLVLAPIRHDQPITADRVASLGAGVRLDFAAAGPERIGAALRAVLDEPGPARAARLMASHLAGLGGASRAADLLERWAHCAHVPG
ncbi:MULTISPECIES: glycosyltransferase [unclassified Streptomyces]|uniref:glycosyltransferase n=1 Tax=unclassified Streptomyces TaxID=2593676 RepID=UPI00068C3AD7|nr:MULTISPECIES: glycosyltransferase [unclassified Streptomyces]MCH0559324.1 glycosyltransferase family 1 protein [Streptomyces sp. MUM 16J]